MVLWEVNKMFYHNNYDYGFPLGTFEIGDTVFSIKVNTHRFLTTPKCPFCNTTGLIEFKRQIFVCPAFHGNKTHIDVDEWVVEKIGKIKSKVTMSLNDCEDKEIYFTNNCFTDKFFGVQICLQRDGTCTYFKSEEEAQKKCDEFNTPNKVFERLRVYKE